MPTPLMLSMRKHVKLTFGMAVLTAFLGGPVYAASHERDACAEVEKACQAAGYYYHGWPKGKGLIRDCLKPLKEGKSVNHVSVRPADLQACRDRSK